jgi:hypothetical protein
MKTLSPITDSIFAHARGNTVLAWAVPTMGIYFTMLLWSIPKLEQYSHGLKTLDMLPAGYDAAYVRTLFDALGTDGRNFYIDRQIPLDLACPGLFSARVSMGAGWC